MHESIFITSDTHFNHRNVIQYCGRPFQDEQEMNEIMIERWNSSVPEDGLVYHLGDFFMGPRDQWPGLRDRLNGDIILVHGNHDPLKHVERCGFLQIEEEMFVKLNGVTYWMHHYPLLPDGMDTRRPKATQSYDVALCGHIHEKWLVNDQSCINVGCDWSNYTPYTLRELEELASKHGLL